MDINGREYFLDEAGRPRWEDNDRLVPPITWELHANQGRRAAIKGRADQVVGRSVRPVDEPDEPKHPGTQVDSGSFR